jgi:hypothetical protein
MLAILISISGIAVSNDYKLDDKAIELRLSQSEDVTLEIAASFKKNEVGNLMAPSGSVYMMPDEGVNQELLWGILVLVVPFVGWPVPIHRLVLGAGGNGVGIWAAYCFTLSGCGIINLVDGIMLIIDGAEDGSKYVDNGKFLMWLDK